MELIITIILLVIGFCIGFIISIIYNNYNILVNDININIKEKKEIIVPKVGEIYCEIIWEEVQIKIIELSKDSKYVKYVFMYNGKEHNLQWSLKISDLLLVYKKCN